MMHSMDIDEGPLEGADDYGERLFDNTAQDLNERMDMEAIRINAEAMDMEAIRINAEVDDSDVLKLKEQQDIGGHLKGNPSLALIRKQAKREENERRAEDDSNNQMSKRVKIANFASEDSMLRATKLYTYFCKFCGDWCLITDAGKLNRLTQRRSDGSIVIQETVFTARLNVNGAKRKTIIRRENGKCEEQYRFQCKGCGNLVGYRCNPLGELSPACYIFQDTLCEEQSAAMKFQ